MSKVNCPCGWQISNGAMPSINNGWLMSDIEQDALPEILEDTTELINLSRDVWECTQCGRLAIGNRIDNSVIWYKPEAGGYAGLFAPQAKSGAKHE